MENLKGFDGRSLWRLPAVLLAFLLQACTPSVKVEAPSEPITINLNIKLDAAKKHGLVSALTEGVPAALEPLNIAEAITGDGAKYMLEDGNWLMFRLSGTEPVARCYIDADSARSLAALEAAAKQFLGEFM